MVTPYKLYGKSELEHIREKAVSTSRKWLQDWVGDMGQAEGMQLSVSGSLQILDEAGNDNVRIYDNEGQSIALMIDDRSQNSLLAAVVKLDSKGSLVSVSNVARAIVDDVLVDYINRLFRLKLKAGQYRTSSADNDDLKDSALRVGSLEFSLHIEDMQISILVPGSVAGKLCSDLTVKEAKPASQGATVLTRPEHCDINGFVKLALQVGSAELEYGTVANIAVGDVIRLDSRIDEPLSINTEDNQYVCQAYLGKRSDKKAAKIILNK